jgi:ADP-ribose pyrophosphatase YjhB (NUDIX family)
MSDILENSKFIIRVYGITINEDNEVLLSDEYMLGMRMTKFPGGGMNYGEGMIDCLKREALEEFGQEIEITEHLYTTDFFQETIFYKGFQLISVYYKFKFKNPIRFKISTRPFDFEKDVEGSQSFRWVKLTDLAEEMFTFPIDRIVAGKLVGLYS